MPRHAVARSALALGLPLLALVLVPNPAAAEKLTLLLNWYPTADH